MAGIGTWHLVRYRRSTTAAYGPDPQTLLTCKVTDQGTPNLTINAALLTLRSLPQVVLTNSVYLLLTTRTSTTVIGEKTLSSADHRRS
jgi:hypothetical protein